MELDDLKSTWNSQDGNTENQELTFKIIDQMTQKTYKSKIKKITYPEFIGSLICLTTIVFIGINFNKLDTIFLQGVGVLSIVLLLLLSIIGFVSIRSLTRAENINKPYAEALKTFATQKIKFYKLQKVNITLSYLLLVTTIILMSKFFVARDLTNSKYFWTFAFTIGYIFLLFFSTVVSKFYKKTLRQTEELLQEIQS